MARGSLWAQFTQGGNVLFIRAWKYGNQRTELYLEPQKETVVPSCELLVTCPFFNDTVFGMAALL